MGVNKKIKSLKKMVGLSLMELMITMGLLGFVSIGVMKMTGNAFKVKKKIDTKLTEQGLLFSATTALKDPNSCKKTLMGKKIDESINAILRATDINIEFAQMPTKSILEADKIYGMGSGGSIKVLAITLRADRDVWQNNAKNIEARVALTLQYLGSGTTFNKETKDKDEKNDGNKNILNRFIPIEVSLDGDGKINDCAVTSLLSLEKLCSTMGGSFNQGFCNNIQIESLVPGDVAITTQGDLLVQNNLLIGDNAKDPFAKINKQGDATFNSIVVSRDINVLQGNVSILNGSLAVAKNAEISAGLNADNFKLNNGSVIIDQSGELRLSSLKSAATPNPTFSFDSSGKITATDLKVSKCKNGNQNQMALITSTGTKCVSTLCASSSNEINVFNGLDLNGNVLCKTIFSSAQGCPNPGDFATGTSINKDGQLELECCTPICDQSANFCKEEPYPASNYATCPATCSNGSKFTTANYYGEPMLLNCHGICTESNSYGKGETIKVCKVGECGGNNSGCSVGAVYRESNQICSIQCEEKNRLFFMSSDSGTINIDTLIPPNSGVSSIRYIIVGGGGGGAQGQSYNFFDYGSGGGGGGSGQVKSYSFKGNIVRCNFTKGRGGSGGTYNYRGNLNLESKYGTQSFNSSGIDPNGEPGLRTTLTCYKSDGTSLSDFALGGPGGRLVPRYYTDGSGSDGEGINLSFEEYSEFLSIQSQLNGQGGAGGTIRQKSNNWEIIGEDLNCTAGQNAKGGGGGAAERSKSNDPDYFRSIYDKNMTNSDGCKGGDGIVYLYIKYFIGI